MSLCLGIFSVRGIGDKMCPMLPEDGHLCTNCTYDKMSAGIKTSSADFQRVFVQLFQNTCSARHLTVVVMSSQFPHPGHPPNAFQSRSAI